MKNRKLFIPLIVIQMIGFMLLAACKKDQPVQLHDEDKKDPVDSGSYNPNHYLPMKMGASWEYLHENGTIEKVSCTQKVHFEFKDAYNLAYNYDAHQLVSDYPNDALPKIEPILHGTFLADHYRIFRPYRDFCQKASLQNRKIFDINNGILRFQPVYFCLAGPSPSYNIVCLDSSGSLDSFPKVAVMLYAKPEAFQSSINPSEDIDTDMYKLLEPLILEGNAAYSISWYAKGIGLIRREIYENQKLVDRMRLVNYHFPG